MPSLPPPNPYIAGAALGGERGFFGRQDIFREVERTLRRPDDNAIVLYGQRRIGKTSILLQLQRRLPSPPFVPIYVDLMDKARAPIDQVLYELAVTTADEVGISSPTQADFENNPDAFHNIFLPTLYQSLGDERHPVFLLDEFDVLELDQSGERGLPETAAALAFRPYLRRLMTTETRLAFVFAVGRRMDELSVEFLSTFKAAKRLLVSVLAQDAARSLILQAEEQGFLRYDEAAIERIQALTRGHPYLTQLTCQVLFDRAFDLSKEEVPLVTVSDVEEAIPGVLEAGGNAFQWIWDGLPPAERIIFAAIASETEEGTVFSEDDITAILQEAGIRILMKELSLAPRTLVNWQMLEQVDGGYRFVVELMRRWVATDQPLEQVKDELDRINPLADGLYQTAQQFYRQEEVEEAIAQLRRALQTNPNHLKARLLLGTILRDQNQLVEAIDEFEKAFELDPREGRFELLRTLLQQGEALEKNGDDEDALATYNRALAISPREQTAQARRAALWENRGDQALTAGDFGAAIEAYRQAGADEKLAQVKTQKLKTELEQAAKEAEDYETQEQWAKVADVYRRLTELDSDDVRWHQGLKRAEEELWLAERYAEGAGYVQQEEWEKAQETLAEVIRKRHNYQDSAELLALAARRGRGLPDQTAELRRRLYLVAGGAAVILVLAVWGVWSYGQNQMQAETTRLAATATAAEEEAIARLTATAEAQATAVEVDAATRIAAAVNATKAAELDATRTAEARVTQTAEAHATQTAKARSTQIAAGRTATAAAIATMTAQAPTETPTPTRTPRPTPTLTATIDADPTVYDNFNDPSFDGDWNTGLWILDATGNSTVQQQNGVLAVRHETSVRDRSSGLSAIRPRTRTIEQMEFAEISAMLDNNIQASLGNIGLVISTRLNNVNWWFDCTISSRKGLSRAWGGCGSVEGHWKGVEVPFDTWHTLRFEVNPETAAISYIVDGQEINVFTPADPEAFKNAEFYFFVRAWSEDGGLVSGSIDNIRIGQIEQ